MKSFNLLMFIDDNEGTNFYNKFIVEELSMAKKSLFFQKAENALQYFEKTNTAEEQALPDVIFLDINMPKIDGWAFIEKYKKMQLPKISPIIMLSTSLSPRDKAKVNKCPLVYGFWEKPLEEEMLVALQKIWAKNIL